LVSIFTPLVIEGIKSIFNEAWKICIDNDEAPKYLMTFQNLLCRIPKWNAVIVEEERKRIVERSSCGYLEDLITCVHIIQLKVLTCIRVGNKQKKIDISIPKLDVFIHKVYIHVARKVYMNVYLFEKNISPLLAQKNNRELEVIVQECILTAIRESVPTEAIIRAYMDESIEQEEEVIIEPIEEPKGATNAEAASSDKPTEESEEVSANIPEEEAPPAVVPAIQNIDNSPVMTRLTFTDYDKVVDDANQVSEVNAPKTIERLEQISTSRTLQRKLEEEEDDDDYGTPIQIHADDTIDLSDFDVLDEPERPRKNSLELDIEEL
jgi:hypothetical protein